MSDSTVRCQKCGHMGVPSPTVVLDLEEEVRELKAELDDLLGFLNHAVTAITDALADIRVLRDSAHGSVFEQAAKVLRDAARGVHPAGTPTHMPACDCKACVASVAGTSPETRPDAGEIERIKSRVLNAIDHIEGVITSTMPSETAEALAFPRAVLHVVLNRLDVLRGASEARERHPHSVSRVHTPAPTEPVSASNGSSFGNVTRVEVIDHRATSGEALRGRRFVAIDDLMRVELQCQDGGRTLKVFLDDRSHTPAPTGERCPVCGSDRKDYRPGNQFDEPCDYEWHDKGTTPARERSDG